MKQHISTFSTFLLLVISPAILEAQSALIDVGSGSGSAGANVQVPVYLEAAGGAQPAGIQVDVAFDASVLSFVQSMTGDVATAAGKSASSSSPSSGQVRLLVAGLNQNVMGNGVVALLEFQISAGAAVSTSALTASDARVSDPQAQTIPASAGSGLVIVGGGIANPSQIFFPQIADGGGFITSFVLVNPGSSAVTGLLELFGQDGTSLAFNLNGNLDNAFTVSLPAHALAILESSNTNTAISVGWAQLSSSGPMGGSIVYAFATGPGSTISEAGINPSQMSGGFSLSVDTRRGFLAGVAVANPNTTSIGLLLTLYGSNGAQLDQQNRSLGGLKQFAELVEQIFTGAPAGTFTNFTGVITITSTGGRMVGTTLRFNGTLSIFASIPVI